MKAFYRGGLLIIFWLLNVKACAGNYRAASYDKNKKHKKFWICLLGLIIIRLASPSFTWHWGMWPVTIEDIDTLIYVCAYCIHLPAFMAIYFTRLEVCQ